MKPKNKEAPKKPKIVSRRKKGRKGDGEETAAYLGVPGGLMFIVSLAMQFGVMNRPEEEFMPVMSMVALVSFIVCCFFMAVIIWSSESLIMPGVVGVVVFWFMYAMYLIGYGTEWVWLMTLGFVALGIFLIYLAVKFN